MNIVEAVNIFDKVVSKLQDVAFDGERHRKNIKPDWADSLEVELRGAVYPSISNPGEDYAERLKEADQYMDWVREHIEVLTNKSVALTWRG